MTFGIILVNINQSDCCFTPVLQAEKLIKRLIYAVFYLSCIKPQKDLKDNCDVWDHSQPN